MKQQVRVISRLDVKGPRLIKGVHLEGLRPVGEPNDFAKRYYMSSSDELLYIDVVASLYGRSNMSEIVAQTTDSCFIPVTAGGGVRSVEDVRILLNSGADKVAINTAAVSRPDLLDEIANEFGSQCLVLSIEAKQTKDGTWRVFTESGREPSKLDAVAWAVEACNRGVGEVLITSIDREGTGKGFDIELTQSIVDAVTVPVIASGGFGKLDHIDNVLRTGVDAIAIADGFHFNKFTISDVKKRVSEAGYPVRM
ncbi:imidazole glycerol phosphate synthase subunit HisF [Aliamphritea hakodatensis]|uniref:imidazole glycerol phosphate synthase subunit HisF n=1 Tax=Aliamphritea hakodatensis TaxID=2895352 RepID=UPI0022FD6EC2|nr:imidazole glycerol phosphate synthase cyclase subunit [Aliamphritea hakodatensis]